MDYRGTEMREGRRMVVTAENSWHHSSSMIPAQGTATPKVQANMVLALTPGALSGALCLFAESIYGYGWLML
jgi:hypothetical protein